uniref:aromatic amino acid transport family protein n=1 Tax=Salmonella enterica TaxID=28901 RepID=UPI00398C6518
GVWVCCWVWALVFTRFVLVHSGRRIIEANPSYRISASWETITEEWLGKGWNVVNGMLMGFVLYILT